MGSHDQSDPRMSVRWSTGSLARQPRTYRAIGPRSVGLSRVQGKDEKRKTTLTFLRLSHLRLIPTNLPCHLSCASLSGRAHVFKSASVDARIARRPVPPMEQAA